MRSKDRLAELRRVAEGARVYNETVELLEEKAAPGQAAAPADIEHVFQEVERIRSWIDEVNASTQLMRRLHADPTFHSNRHLQEQLEACVSRAAAAGGRAATALRAFRPDGGGEGGGGGEGEPASSCTARRIARWQRAATRRLCADALYEHAAALQALRDERRLLLHRQLQLTDVALTEEERENLLDSKELSLFVDNVRAETAAARGALREAEARRDELARLERALRDVRDLFAQLSLLVAAQQERVDTVEYYALQASEHVESGQQELLKGKVSHARARKKKLSVVVCLAAGLLVVLLVLVLT